MRADAKGKHIIMGNEHPALAIKDDFSVKHSFKAFLHGKINDFNLTVLPSTSPLTIGTAVNETPREDLLSPLFRENPLGDLVPYAVELWYARQEISSSEDDFTFLIGYFEDSMLGLHARLSSSPLTRGYNVFFHFLASPKTVELLPKPF